MRNVLLDLLNDVRTGFLHRNYDPREKIKVLDEAIALVANGEIRLSGADAFNWGQTKFRREDYMAPDARGRNAPYLVIPLAPSEPGVNEKHRRMARAARLSFTQHREAIEHQIEAAARAIARAELDT